MDRYGDISTYFKCFHQASSTRLITFLQNLFHELRRLHGFKPISICSSRQVVTDWVLGGVRAFHPSNLVSLMSWHCARIFGSHFDFWTKTCTKLKVSLKAIEESYLHWSHNLMIPPSLEISPPCLSIQTEHLWRSKALVETCGASTSSVEQTKWRCRIKTQQKGKDGKG